MTEVTGGIFSVLVFVLTFALSLLPLILIWLALARLGQMSRDLAAVRRQVAALAEHSGLPVPPVTPTPSRVNPPTWAWILVAVGVLFILGVLAAAQVRSDGRPVSEDLQFVPDVVEPVPAEVP